jgi:hypothetical protein
MQPAKTKMAGRTKAALWLMIGPTALIITVFILYAILNWLSGAAPTTPVDDGSLFATPSAGVVIANVILFIAGAVTVITWLPGMIIGIVLLTTKK